MPMIAHLVNGDAGPLSKMAETASPNWATASATLGSSNYCSGFITLTSVCSFPPSVQNNKNDVGRVTIK